MMLADSSCTCDDESDGDDRNDDDDGGGPVVRLQFYTSINFWRNL